MRVREIIEVDDDMLREYLSCYAAWRFLAPTCTTEVVVGSEGTGVLPDRPLPGKLLRRLTYRPRRDRGRLSTSARMAASCTR